MGAPLVFVDFEARSAAKLSGKAGTTGRRYAEHPSTRTICACFAVGRDTRGPLDGTHLWLPGMKPPRLPKRFRAVAHNAFGFDRFMWEREGWPEPLEWIDTSICMRRGGFPSASLKYLGELADFPKDTEESKLTLGFSRGRYLSAFKKTGEWLKPPREDLLTSYRYCANDVNVVRVGWYDVGLHHWHHVSDLEDEVFRADVDIMDRGIVFDIPLAKAVLDVDTALTQKALKRARLATPTEARSAPRFKAHLARYGVRVENCKRPTIEPLLRHRKKAVRRLAAARLALSTIAGGKLRAGLIRVSADGRLRDMTKPIGAHTWRWAGQGMQTQNLPK